MENKEHSKILENINRKYCVKRPQYKIALRLLDELKLSNEQKKHFKVLDLGCGIGEFSNILVSLGFRKENIKCCDGLQEFVDQVKLLGFFVYKTDLEFEKLPFSNDEFDLIVSLDVIEHLWNINYYFEEISRVLKNNGFVIITTPNYNFIKLRKNYLFGKFEKVISPRSRHKKFFTEKSFYQEVNNKFLPKSYIGSLPKTNRLYAKNSILLNILSSQLGFLGEKKKNS